ncbi:MAG: bile acid:sodium symporter family protein [Planctomycetia bacterium]|nr:bile acid:sodium symporter family protein [Planctomycetia bacterium]
MFVLCLLIVIGVAWFYPEMGSGAGLAAIANWGVSVIFFFYGLRLNWVKICEGLSNLRLHVVVHLATFVLFPLLVLPFAWYFRNAEENLRLLWLGTFFLATLPSTVSSSVVMVNLARGNVPAAIFDASISSLLGVFLTPLWMQVFVASSGEGKSLGPVVVSLVLQVIVPVVLGIVLHRGLGWFSQRYDKTLRQFDQAVILLIVYTSFCHSFSEKMFAGMSFHTLLVCTVGLVALFFLVYGILHVVCRLLKFSREDTITTLFCGSKKSLVHGTVMSQVILADPRLAGILILPTMIYHAMQLLVVSVIARRKGGEVQRLDGAGR